MENNMNINLDNLEEMKELLSVEINLQHNKLNFDDLGIVDALKIKDLIKIEFIFE